MMEIEVKGHSGCQIEIVREENEIFVCKSSNDVEYLPRLLRQAEKQKNAFNWEYQHIRVPEIFNVEQDKSHVSIKMEYVYSRNFIEYFESAGFEQVDYFVKALILFVEKELMVSPIVHLPTFVTLEKYNDVKRKILKNTLLVNDKDVRQLLVDTENIFTSFAEKEYIDIPVGVCHGDLTFSNILFNGNNYYLIDFLDSFIESPLLDIVKIRQDSAHLWSQLMYTKNYDSLRLKIICAKIDKAIDDYFCKYEWYKNYYQIYQLMNLLRILQYAKEDVVVTYLKGCIREVLADRGTTTKVMISSVGVETKCSDYDLIIPVAADNIQNNMPYVFSLDENGVMLCVKAIQGLNLELFNNIYFTILKKHAVRFDIDKMMQLQFRRFGLDTAKIVVLENSTNSQTETIYQTIKRCKIRGGVFVKDADGYFEGEIRKENSISVFPLEEMTIVDPRHKSYVTIDDMQYITNIIENRVVSHYFNVGGYGFECAKDFIKYYELLSTNNKKVYASHIVYAMLLNKVKFRPIKITNYKDWGNENIFEISRIMNL